MSQQNNLASVTSPETQQALLGLMQFENQEKERHTAAMLQHKSQEHQMKMQDQEGKLQIQQMKMQQDFMKSAQGQQQAHESEMARKQQEWQSKEYEALRQANEKDTMLKIQADEKMAKMQMQHADERSRLEYELGLAKMTGDLEMAKGKSAKLAEVQKKMKELDDARGKAQIDYMKMMGAKEETLAQHFRQHKTAFKKDSDISREIIENAADPVAAAMSDLLIDPNDPNLVAPTGGKDSIKGTAQEAISVVRGREGESFMGALGRNIAAGTGPAMITDLLFGDQATPVAPQTPEQVLANMKDSLTKAIVESSGDRVDAQSLKAFVTGVMDVTRLSASNSTDAKEVAKRKLTEAVQATEPDKATGRQGMSNGQRYAVVKLIGDAADKMYDKLDSEIREGKRNYPDGEYEQSPEGIARLSLMAAVKQMRAMPNFVMHAGGLIQDPEDIVETTEKMEGYLLSQMEPQKKKALIEAMGPEGERLSKELDLDDYFDMKGTDELKSKQDQLKDAMDYLDINADKDMADVEVSALEKAIEAQRKIVGDRYNGR